MIDRSNSTGTSGSDTTRITIVDDVAIPSIGLGTWRMSGQRCRQAVETALEEGYRLIDTAQLYGNEREVGAALAAAPVAREDVFLTTKIAPGNADETGVIESTKASLDRLNVDSIDLLLLHWPSLFVSLEETMGAMASLRDRGLVRHLGVSNFTVRRLQRAQAAAPCSLLTNQVQCHPYYPRHELHRHCLTEEMLLTAYSPLCHGGIVEDDVLAAIGRPYRKSAAQVALRWAIQRRNVVAIPKASSRQHISENIAIFDFELTEVEMSQVERRSRLRTGLGWVRGRIGL